MITQTLNIVGYMNAKWSSTPLYIVKTNADFFNFILMPAVLVTAILDHKYF